MTGDVPSDAVTRLMRILVTPYEHLVAKLEDVIALLNGLPTPEERRRMVAVLLQVIGIPALPSRAANDREPAATGPQYERIRRTIGLKIRRHELTFTQPLRARKNLVEVADAVCADLEYLQPMGQAFQAMYLLQLASEGRTEGLIPYVETGDLPKAADFDGIIEAAFTRPGLFARMVALAQYDELDIAQMTTATATVLRGVAATDPYLMEAALTWFVVALSERIAQASGGGGHMHPSFIMVRPAGVEPADSGPQSDPRAN